RDCLEICLARLRPAAEHLPRPDDRGCMRIRIEQVVPAVVDDRENRLRMPDADDRRGPATVAAAADARPLEVERIDQRRHADDERAHHRRRLAQYVALELSDLEPRATNALGRRPVAVAAVSEPGADAVQAILPAREPRLIGAHVLDEQKATSGLQHATK